MAARGMTAEPAPTVSVAVSVCIANYNGMSVIDACLRSVLAQDCGFPVEIIVHDDASTDGSAAHVRRHYPGTTVIESAGNVGFCVSNNRMANVARGEYLLLLNNDAELFPDALRTFHAAASAAGGPAILGLPQYDAATGELIDRGSLFDPFLNPLPNLDSGRRDVGMIIGACLWTPTALWREIGGFPEWFHTLAEDMYLCCVASLWGYPVQVLPDSGFRHWVGKSLGGGKVTQQLLSTTFRRRALSERNKSFVMILAYPAPVFHVLFPLHLALLGTEGLALTMLKRDGRFWRDIYHPCLQALWHERKRLFRLRRELQAKRRIDPLRFLKAFTPLPHKLRMLARHGLPAVK
jgi:GT2 family glycosyltransferase